MRAPWMFLVGRSELLGRPAVRLPHRVHSDPDFLSGSAASSAGLHCTPRRSFHRTILGHHMSREIPDQTGDLRADGLADRDVTIPTQLAHPADVARWRTTEEAAALRPLQQR